MEKKIAQATQVTVKISEFLLVYKKKEREREDSDWKKRYICAKNENREV